jgi:membrane protease YdiL (CAAX protease family)
MKSTTSQGRNFISKIFLSPSETRLRAGWRLLLHTILFGLVSSLFFLASLALSLPLGGESIDTNLSTFFIELLSILVATWIARRFLDRRSLPSLGLKISQQAWMDLLVGIAIAGVMMGVIFTLELGLGWTTIDQWAWQTESVGSVLVSLTIGLLAFVFVGFSEEILSRGYHLQNLKDGLNLGWALVISSSIFAFLHAANPNSTLISTLGILLAGFFLAYGWIRTGQLWLSIGLHIGWNFFEGNIFGFPVSGLTTYRLIHHTTTGPELITGGAFGPEAGLILLPALALGVFLIYRYTSRVRSTPTTPEPLNTAGSLNA